MDSLGSLDMVSLTRDRDNFERNQIALEEQQVLLHLSDKLLRSRQDCLMLQNCQMQPQAYMLKLISRIIKLFSYFLLLKHTKYRKLVCF